VGCVSNETAQPNPAPRVGAVFPQTELGHDTAAIRTWAQEIERAGYRHALVYDHVVGADPEVHAPWTGPYNVRTTFREPFVLFGYLAALTSLELVTGVIILPQRQTALVAKQAAEVDLLTGGRSRLGVGIGWNQVEYQSLGKSFTNRGRRSEEQIALLRRLFTEASVTFEGEFEQVVGAGINPLPVQRPVPIWIGGSSRRAYERIGRLADGWFPQVALGAELDEARGIVERSAREAGRDPAALGMEGRVQFAGDAEATAAKIRDWQAAGATHVSVNTMGAGLSTVDEHLKALTDTAAALGLLSITSQAPPP
jgi:probable F420-dependent oxidoreductase